MLSDFFLAKRVLCDYNNFIMKQRNNYYVNRKNPLVWLAALLGVCAAAGYIANVTCGKGAGVSGAMVWLRVVLPVLAAVYFCWQLLLHGKDRVYRLALPYWMLLLSFIYATFTQGFAWYWVILFVALDLCLAVLMHKVTTGTLRTDWLMIILAGIPMAGIVWVCGETIHAPFELCAWLSFLPDLLLLFAYIPLCFALRKRPEDGKYYPTWGDRPDGRRVRSLSPITVVGSYIMPDRNEASNQFKSSIEITRIDQYIRKKKLAGFEGFGITEVFLAAYVRTIAKFPAGNRFLSGQKIYSRDDDIQFCMTIKKEMTAEAPDTIIKLHLTPADTIDTVYEKFHAAVAEVRKSSELDSEFDGVAKLLGMVPGVLLKFLVWLLKTLDYFGLLPGFLLEVSPFHGSVFFTSMGSLGIPAIYHHLYDFGNLPLFCAFGCKRRARELNSKGEPVERKYVDYSFTMDERICDGFYYAAALKHFHKLMQNPEQLEQPPEEIVRDIP